MFSCVLTLSEPRGVSGQVWYLIVLIPDLRSPLYFDLASEILLFYVLFVVALIEFLAMGPSSYCPF